jgi:argininosuccinate synthase
LNEEIFVAVHESGIGHDHCDAAGFIRLNALRLRTLGRRRKKLTSSP